MTERNLEALYTEAQQALKAKDYDRATSLLKQVLVIDDDYKDASRLLARTVKLRRRRWYNQPLLWGGLGLTALLALSIWLAPRVRDFYASQIPATVIPSTIAPPTIASLVVESTVLPPTITPVPLRWKRVSLGQDVKRDTITAITVDPRDQDVIYIGMEHAGIYKSIDGGGSWVPSHSGLERAHIKEIVIDPQNPNILNVHTYSNQIYRTTDGATSWTLMLDNLENYNSQDYYMAFFARRLIVDPHSGQHLILTDRNGWYESEDSGESWRYEDNDWGDCPALLGAVGFHPSEPNILFLSQMGDDGNCKNGLYRWKKDGASPPELVFRYWRRGGSDPLHTSVITDIQTALSGQGLGYLYVRNENGGVFVSNDAGTTWRGNQNPSGLGLDSIVNCPALTTRQDGDALGFCYTRTSGKVMRGYGGENWRELINTPPSLAEDWTSSGPAVFAISHFPGRPESIILGGRGIYISFDDGATWATMSNGLPGISVDLRYSHLDDSLFQMERMRCAGDEPLFQSTDQGQTWNLITAQGCGLAIDADGVTLYRSNQRNIFLTRDGGISWSLGARPTINDSQVVSIATHPEQPGMAIAKIRVNLSSSLVTSEFYSSSDRGFNWQKQGEISENSSSEDALLYTPGRSGIIYSAGAQSNVFRFSDEDENWTACAPMDTTSPNSASILAIHPNDPNILYLATLGKGIQYSDDGCQSWHSMDNGLQSLFVNSLTIDPNNPDTIYAGTDGGAFVSFDSGQTWNEINDGLLGATVVYSIVVDKGSNVYAATPYGIFKLEGK